MVGKIFKVILLASLCCIYVSCSTDSRSFIEGRVVDKLTDTALNSDSSDDNSDSSSLKGSKSRSKRSYGGSATGDDHYIDDDVIFVSKEPFKGSGWMYVQTAKLIQAASSKTKREGQFMIIHSGDEIWTKNFWRTRIASEKDIRIGTIVIIFERSGDDSVYVAPENKEDALANNWFMAKVTDLSNKYRGYVIVSGGYKVSMENMRIIVKAR